MMPTTPRRIAGLEAFGNIYYPASPIDLGGSRSRARRRNRCLASPREARRPVPRFSYFSSRATEFMLGRQLYGGSINQFNHAFKVELERHCQADAANPRTDRGSPRFMNPGDLYQKALPIPAGS